MQLIITGTPGVGKTTVAKLLGKKLKCKVVNEKEFALKQAIGQLDTETDELFVPITKLQKAMRKLLEKEKNIIIEGHLLCEIRLNVNAVIVLRLHPEILGVRLGDRGYRGEKIQDNVFCEGIDYCKKRTGKKYPASKIIEIEAGKTPSETGKKIIDALKGAGKI